MRVEYHVCESLLNCSDTLSVKRWATVTSAVASQGVIHSRFILFFCMSYRKTGLLHPSSPFGHHSLSSVHKPCILSRFSAPINILNLCSLAFAKGHLCYQNSILSIVSASSIVLVHLLLKTFDLFFILKFFPLLTLKLVSACVPYPLFSLSLALSHPLHYWLALSFCDDSFCYLDEATVYRYLVRQYSRCFCEHFSRWD